jgi:hypothetical protein
LSAIVVRVVGDGAVEGGAGRSGEGTSAWIAPLRLFGHTATDYDVEVRRNTQLTF